MQKDQKRSEKGLVEPAGQVQRLKRGEPFENYGDKVKVKQSKHS